MQRSASFAPKRRLVKVAASSLGPRTAARARPPQRRAAAAIACEPPRHPLPPRAPRPPRRPPPRTLESEPPPRCGPLRLQAPSASGGRPRLVRGVSDRGFGRTTGHSLSAVRPAAVRLTFPRFPTAISPMSRSHRANTAHAAYSGHRLRFGASWARPRPSGASQARRPRTSKARRPPLVEQAVVTDEAERRRRPGTWSGTGP